MVCEEWVMMFFQNEVFNKVGVALAQYKLDGQSFLLCV